MKAVFVGAFLMVLGIFFGLGFRSLENTGAFFVFKSPFSILGEDALAAADTLEVKYRVCGNEWGALRAKCYHRSAKEIGEVFTFQAVLRGLEIIQKEGKGPSYHDFLHYLAREEVERSKDFSDTLRRCTPVFFNACYHGAASGYLERTELAGAPHEEVARALSRACEPLKSGKNVGFYTQCVHGIGHGLMLMTDMELPISLEFCDTLESHRGNCYEGVFMENFPGSATSESEHPSKYLKDDDPLYPCSILSERYLRHCYSFITSYFHYKSEYNWEKVGKMCELISSEYRSYCYVTIGSSGASNFEAPAEMSGACHFLSEGGPKEQCIKGVVLFFSDRFGGTEDMFRMFDFCSSVEQTYKKACYEQVSVNLRNWIPDSKERVAACGIISSEEERQWCLLTASQPEDI